jgi:hypothetical protein
MQALFSKIMPANEFFYNFFNYSALPEATFSWIDLGTAS